MCKGFDGSWGDAQEPTPLLGQVVPQSSSADGTVQKHQDNVLQPAGYHSLTPPRAALASPLLPSLAINNTAHQAHHAQLQERER